RRLVEAGEVLLRGEQVPLGVLLAARVAREDAQGDAGAEVLAARERGLPGPHGQVAVPVLERDLATQALRARRPRIEDLDRAQRLLRVDLLALLPGVPGDRAPGVGPGGELLGPRF